MARKHNNGFGKQPICYGEHSTDFEQKDYATKKLDDRVKLHLSNIKSAAS